MNTKMTLENLAKKMDKGFDTFERKMNDGLDAFDKRLNLFERKMDERFNLLDTKIDTKIDVLERKIDTKISREIVDLSDAIKKGFKAIDELDRNKVSYVEHNKLVKRVSNIELKGA